MYRTKFSRSPKITEWSPCFLYLNCVIPPKSSEPPQAINTVIYSIIRELKKRWRQREWQKAIGLGWQNNNLSRVSRFFCTFLCRHCMTTTWLSLISRFLGDVNTKRKLPFSSPGLWYSQFYNSTTKKKKKIANNWQIKRDGKSAIKFEAMRSHFF